MNKKLLSAVVALALGAGAGYALNAFAQQKPDKVVIGYLNLVNAQLVTKSLGLHEKEMGVPIEWVKFGSGGDVNRAVAANQLSFGGVGNPPATIGIGRGLALGQPDFGSGLARDLAAAVGPRSAHIAGLPYACFSDAALLEGAKPVTIVPRPGDPDDYLVLERRDGTRVAVTLTCAANALSVPHPGDYCWASPAAARRT